jgi:hypothetical protein
MNFVKKHHTKLFLLQMLFLLASVVTWDYDNVSGTLAAIGIPFGIAACIGISND